MRWAIKFHAFALNFVPLKAIKGQALPDFLAKHPCLEVNDPSLKLIAIFNSSLRCCCLMDPNPRKVLKP